MRDRAWFLEAARNAGWEVVAENGADLIERGAEVIEIEYGSGGIPRTIRRTDPAGKRHVIGQNYIRMAEVLGWLVAPPPERAPDAYAPEAREMPGGKYMSEEQQQR